VAKQVPLEGPALAFARSEFARFYRATPPEPPRRFARREFAAFPFATSALMRRHTAFGSAEEFRTYLAREAPRHVYYSSAYYRLPDDPVMGQKDWLGADLIFDLDADHLRRAEALDYPQQLALVRRRFRDLLEEFLFRDFGIDPEQTTLVFSGGRGYHVHVWDPAYLELTSAERREIVEYVMGVGVDPTSALVSERGGAEPGTDLDLGGRGPSGRGRHARPPTTFRRLVPPEAPGWPGRVSRSVLALLERWEGEGAEAAAAELTAANPGKLPPAAAKKLARELVTREKGRMIRETLALDVFSGRHSREEMEAFLEAILSIASIGVQGETDAPVTTDIHRLIRLPGSRHGGTGLVVRPVRREDLLAFDPLRDAVAPDAGEPTVEVTLAEPVSYPFGEDRIDGAAAERLRLSPSAALFLVLRGEASLTPRAG
jgi:DNA primase small subunit